MLFRSQDVGLDPEIKVEEELGKAFMEELNRISIHETAKTALAFFNYQANMTDENLKIFNDVSIQLSQDQQVHRK